MVGYAVGVDHDGLSTLKIGGRLSFDSKQGVVLGWRRWMLLRSCPRLRHAWAISGEHVARGGPEGWQETQRERDASWLRALGGATQTTSNSISAALLLQSFAMRSDGSSKLEQVARLEEKIRAQSEVIQEHETAMVELERVQSAAPECLDERLRLFWQIFLFVDMDDLRRTISCADVGTAAVSLPSIQEFFSGNEEDEPHEGVRGFDEAAGLVDWPTCQKDISILDGYEDRNCSVCAARCGEKMRNYYN